MVQASTHSTPQGYVKDTIKELNGAWGDANGFSAVEKPILLQLFLSNFKKATTYATNVDPEACCLWVDLELLDLQDKINAAERLFARWCQGELSLVLLHQLEFYLSLSSKLVDLVVLLCTFSVFTSLPSILPHCHPYQYYCFYHSKRCPNTHHLSCLHCWPFLATKSDSYPT